MKVHFTVVGQVERIDDRVAELPVPPRVGEAVYYGLDGEGTVYRVRSVSWYPDDGDVDAYVVLGS